MPVKSDRQLARELFWKSQTDVYLSEMARRMRCERCGNREAVIFGALHRAPAA
jgi:hypothetical protein